MTYCFSIGLSWLAFPSCALSPPSFLSCEPSAPGLSTASATSRSSVMRTLREYLQIEWDVKKQEKLGERVIDKDNLKGCTPRCPQQLNFSDCGVFVLQYVESFFERPICDYSVPIKGLLEWFTEEVALCKREDLRLLVVDLTSQLNPELEYDPAADGCIIHADDEDDEQNMPDLVPSALMAAANLQRQQAAVVAAALNRQQQMAAASASGSVHNSAQRQVVASSNLQAVTLSAGVPMQVVAGAQFMVSNTPVNQQVSAQQLQIAVAAPMPRQLCIAAPRQQLAINAAQHSQQATNSNTRFLVPNHNVTAKMPANKRGNNLTQQRVVNPRAIAPQGASNFRSVTPQGAGNSRSATPQGARNAASSRQLAKGGSSKQSAAASTSQVSKDTMISQMMTSNAPVPAVVQSILATVMRNNMPKTS